ncbi:MAG: hypothetical protein FJ335_04035 [Sphingomonadales bacterium]|nr:hypothetical protein [Sphingomonadales bacterium]
MTWVPRPDQYDVAWWGPPPALVLDCLKRLRSDRAAGDPRGVDRGKLTAAAAEQRATCATALVRLWTIFAERRTVDLSDPVSALGASWATLQTDAEAAFQAALLRAKATPSDDHMTARYVLGFVEYWLRSSDGQAPAIVTQHVPRDRKAA